MRLLAMLLLFVTFHTTDMLHIQEVLEHDHAVSVGLLTTIGLLMLPAVSAPPSSRSLIPRIMRNSSPLEMPSPISIAPFVTSSPP